MREDGNVESKDLSLVTFQQMSDHGKVKVGLKAKTHGMIELFEMPFEGFTRFHHDFLKTLKYQTVMLCYYFCEKNLLVIYINK